MMCGGHSLGGVLTAFFAEWDFDGDHSTTGDAGYNQCSGYFALDTRISTRLPGFGGDFPEEWVPLLRFGAGAVQAGLETGVVPRALSAPAVINTETMNLLAVAGLAARLDPGGVSDLATYPPPSFNTDTTYRILFSKDYPAFLKGSPAVRDFRFTNAAALGGLLDDNSQPLAFMQASLGFWDGGKIVDKEFPAPNDLEGIGLGGLTRLLGTEKKAIPDEPGGPLYTWRNFDRVGARTTRCTRPRTAPRSRPRARRSPTSPNWPAACRSTLSTSPSTTSRRRWSPTSRWPRRPGSPTTPSMRTASPRTRRSTWRRRAASAAIRSPATSSRPATSTSTF
ncbi:hypothetical protein ACFQY7_26475 [Actinomadura luteofluorescens]|uniref:hypothetical protein n=1 Tax=Actinomadura luteofluorescens TaxID=46163 RepID=UPI003628A56A